MSKFEVWGGMGCLETAQLIATFDNWRDARDKERELDRNPSNHPDLFFWVWSDDPAEQCAIDAFYWLQDFEDDMSRPEMSYACMTYEFEELLTEIQQSGIHEIQAFKVHFEEVASSIYSYAQEIASTEF